MPSSHVYTIKEGDKASFPTSSGQHSSQGKYTGMVKERYTTDIFFLLAIFALWTAMSIVGGIACQQGNPYRLIAPMNDIGSNCGYSPSVADQPVWYQVSSLSMGVCMKECPEVPVPVAGADITQSVNRFDYVCLDWVQNQFGFSNSDPRTADNALFTTYLQAACMSINTQTGKYTFVQASPVACGCNLKMATTNILNRCVFTDSATRGKYNQGFPDYFQAFMGDIITARYIIFCFGFPLALVLSFAVSHMLRFECLGLVVVWLGISLTFAFMAVCVGVCWWQAGLWAKESPEVHSTKARWALQAFSILMIIFAGLFLCACVFLRRSINLAIKVVALAATAVESMMLLVFTPVLHVFAMSVFLVPCLFYGFNVASNGTYTQQYYTEPMTKVQIPAGKTYQLNDANAGEQLWFLFFCLLWTMNFIAGLGSLVIATAVATWDFTPFDQRSTVGSHTVLWAYGCVLRYHMGTAAFGALLISIVQFLRAVALYVEKHCKDVQKNPVARVVFCCVDCCLYCLEKCMKFISKQCYIQTAIHGSSFCTGCKDAFFTVARNIFSVGAVSVVSGIALTIGKVFVTAVAGVSSYLFFQGYFQTQMYDDIACTVLVMILAWISSSVFSEVFHMAADTVIMCYITDSEQNEGVPQHAAQDMAEFLAEHGALTADHKRVTESGPGAAPGDTQTQAPSVPHAL